MIHIISATECVPVSGPFVALAIGAITIVGFVVSVISTDVISEFLSVPVIRLLRRKLRRHLPQGRQRR